MSTQSRQEQVDDNQAGSRWVMAESRTEKPVFWITAVGINYYNELFYNENVTSLNLSLILFTARRLLLDTTTSTIIRHYHVDYY